MKIKQVEELVGITRKNIRFYEDQGLLNVERAENGYREYHQADVIRLQEIKLFRKMDISIEEMKLLFEKKKSLRFQDGFAAISFCIGKNDWCFFFRK